MTKIMTMNLANYTDHDEWPSRLEAVAAIISDKKPDIIALQEVRFDPDFDSENVATSTKRIYQNMGEQLLRRINLDSHYSGSAIVTQPCMFYDSMLKGDSSKFRYYPQPKLSKSSQEMWEGLSTISRVPILETGSRFLTTTPRAEDQNRRVTQYVAVETRESPLYIFNCHFSYDSKSFESNMKETIDYIEPFNNRFCLLVGDLNHDPRTETFKAFKDLEGAGFVDLWSSLHPDQEGNTTPSCAPERREDFIWVNSRIGNGRTCGIELVATEPYAGRKYPSDHFGLIAEITL
jgi:endonuclease/exonuclease/phosphatase family metal-dependent hydrolase